LGKRTLVVLVAAAIIAAGGYFLRAQPPGLDGGPSLDEMAGAIGAPIMRNVFRGHVPGRSGEIVLVPRPHRYIVDDWDLRTLVSGSPDTFVSHPNPWAYLARVPLILYGPGYVPGGVTITDEVDLTGLARTYAGLLGIEGPRAAEAPLPGIERASQRPRVIFTVVLDGGGWNVLQQHPSAWPNIRRISERGTTYTNATVGSAPSLTGAIHANLGTGTYPRAHGIPNNPGWSVEDLRVPTVSELWDERNDNAAVVAALAFDYFHLGMIGHGSGREGGDRDIAVVWRSEGDEWATDGRHFELPGYLEEADLDALGSYERDLDERDGVDDDRWFGHTLEELQDPLKRPSTPAFARLHGDATMDVVLNEGVGRDEITDLVWIEMKMPDFAGHQFNMVRPEVGDVVREVDSQIARFKGALDESVGEGGYVLAITADHGQEPLAEATGGWRINPRELERDIEQRFGDIVERVTTLDIQVDRQQVRALDIELADVARFIGTYTIGDNVPLGGPGAGLVPEARLDERLFAGAFPTRYLRKMTPEDIASFGDSEYEQGILTIGRGRG
jgi:predicted AlkP superfamily pyrophosphatase or phosphodiesterase